VIWEAEAAPGGGAPPAERRRPAGVEPAGCMGWASSLRIPGCPCFAGKAAGA